MAKQKEIESFGLKYAESRAGHTKPYIWLFTFIALLLILRFVNPLKDIGIPSEVWAWLFALIFYPIMVGWFLTKYVLIFRSKKIRLGNIELTTIHGDIECGTINPIVDSRDKVIMGKQKILRVGGRTDFFWKGRDFAIMPDVVADDILIRHRINVDEYDFDFSVYDYPSAPPFIRRKFMDGKQIIMPGFKPMKSKIYWAPAPIIKDPTIAKIQYDAHRMIKYLSSMLTRDEYEMARKQFMTLGVSMPEEKPRTDDRGGLVE